MVINMSIGDNIKKWRELRNLTQSDLAELVGISDKTVSSWEINRTEPKMGMIEKICMALNCKKTDIVGADEPIFFLREDSPSYGVTSREYERLLYFYKALNKIGQKEAIKRIEELACIEKYTEDHLLPQAAHNADADDPEQQRLMQEDLGEPE